jgi:purine-binding chemotaxis protein CheW
MLRENWDWMDIAKIRKKAKEREKDGKEPETPVLAPEETGEEKNAAEGQAPSEEAVPLPAAGEEEGEIAPGVAAPLAAAPAVIETPREEPAAAAAGEPSPEEGDEAENVVELLTFSLSKEEFAFRVPEVEEIIRHQPITRVPTMPDYLLGITSLRGKIIPVIDLKTRIVFRGGRHGEEQASREKATGKEKILILLGPNGPIGVTIDRVMGVVRLPGNKVLAPPAHLKEEERKFVDGVVILHKRFVSIVRCEEALQIEVM